MFSRTYRRSISCHISLFLIPIANIPVLSASLMFSRSWRSYMFPRVWRSYMFSRVWHSYMFSCAWRRSHVFPCLAPVTCLPHLARACMSSRACHTSHLFPRLPHVAPLPALATSCMFLLPFLIGSCLCSDCLDAIHFTCHSRVANRLR